MIKAIIFDVDGTLVDSVDAHAASWQRVLAQFGQDVSFHAIRRHIGKGGDQLMPEFLSPAKIERDGAAIEHARSALFQTEYLADVKPFPAVAALFQHILRNGQRIALGSSGKPEELSHYEKLLGIDSLKLPRTTSSDAERSKPHPDIFQAALERLGVEPASVIAVGDSPYDAIAATRAGIGCLGMLCGGFPAQDLQAAGCMALYETPADLLNRYDQSPLMAKPPA